MGINYNIDFLLAALIFLLVIWFHFMKQKLITDNSNTRLFQIFIILGLGDIIFDLLSTLLIILEDPMYAGLLYCALILLYVFQMLVPCVLYLYTLLLCGWDFSDRKKWGWFLCMIPTLLLFAAALSNYYTGILFSVTMDGVYVKGTFYLAMYFHALFYAVVIAVHSIVHYAKLGKRQFGIIMETLGIMVVCVLVQCLYPEILMTGFAIALCITVLLLSFHNPYVYTDNATGLMDIKCFQEWVEEQCRRRRDFHVVAIELHQLKRLNTIYGADWNTQLLYLVAQKLQEIAGTPYVYRISGKRFMLAYYSFEDYEAVQMKLKRFFDRPIEVAGEQVLLPVVIAGVPYGNEKGRGTLIAYAEYLMELVPNSQESVVVRGNEETKRGFFHRKTIEEYLPQAISQDLFQMYYQPVYSIREQRFVALEALSRLQHPRLGPVSPEIFIRVAEENGQINQIGLLQFRRVCRFVKEHPELTKKLKNIKYNLSPAQLLKRGYGAQLVQILKEYDLDPAFFQFEITETVATKYKEELCEAILEFEKNGIGLCMDDFGSGYANLNAVLRVPFECIKIDRSMLNGILDDELAGRFYRDIVTILREQGYTVIAEGVEEKAEVKLLTEWGVDMIQGFYFSKPLSEQDLLQVLQ